MTPDVKQKLRQMLLNDEAYKQFPYIDTTGHTTVGIGRNLTDRGISLDEALVLLDDDIIYFTNKLDHLLSFFGRLSDQRKLVCINLCFNLGLHGFLGFHKMLDAFERNNYEEVANEIINSKAHDQCPERYQRLA